MMEKTFFIIKPEVFSDREKIKKFIESHSNLKVISSRIMVLQDNDVRALYLDDIGTDLQTAAKQHLIGRQVEAGIVEGDNAIDEFLSLCGKYPDNRLCADNTIRKVFGKAETVMYGNTTYFLNAIHKSSRNEAASSVQWYHDKIEELGSEKTKGS